MTSAIIAADLEGTLTTGETWKGVGRYLAAHGRALAYRAFLAAHLPDVLLARTGLRDETTARRRWMTDLAQRLRGLTDGDLAEMAEWIVERELWPKRRAGVLAELACQRADGARVLLVSGTYQPVLDAFARRIGAEALGTPLAMIGGRATGRLAGPLNQDEVKAARLRDALAGAALSAAYGDTPADLPMLELGAQAIVVGHHPALLATARERGWRCLETA